MNKYHPDEPETGRMSQASGDGSVIDRVEPLIRRISEAILGRRGSVLEACLSIDFRYTNSMGKTMDKPAYISGMIDAAAMEWRSQTFEISHIREMNGLVFVWGIARDAFSYKGTEYKAQFASLRIYGEEKGRLVWLAGQSTEIADSSSV